MGNAEYMGDEAQKELIVRFDKMTAEDLESAMDEIDEKISLVEDEFEDEIDKLQTKYDELETQVEATKASLMSESGYNFMKKVLDAKDNKPEPTTGDEL